MNRNWITAAEYAGIGAWEVAFRQAAEENGDTITLAYYAEWDDKASNAYSAIHNVSEDLNIWDTSIGYREFEFGGKTCYGINTCMFGQTYLYTELKKIKVGIDENGKTIYDNFTYFNYDLIYDNYKECIDRLSKIRQVHKKFKVDNEGQFILPTIDILFYSPPCQTYSIAGKRKGSTVDKGNMFWNTLVRIRKLKPMYAIMENVKGLPSGDTKKDFNNMLSDLSDSSYQNYSKILNSKDFGIPQNRERVFIHSIRNDVYESGKRFLFPQPLKLEIALKDILEDEVDKKYYLSQKMVDGLQRKGTDWEGSFKPKTGDDIARCLTARMHKMGAQDNYIIGNPTKYGFINQNTQASAVYDARGVSQTITAREDRGFSNRASEGTAIVIAPQVLTPKRTDHGKKVRKAYENGIHKESRHTMNKMVSRTDGVSNTITSVQKDNYVLQLKDGTKRGYAEAHPGNCINLDQPNSPSSRNRVPGKIASTLTTSCNIGYYNGFTIRKLTPLECWRLQGFKDEHYYLAVLSYVLTFHSNLDESFICELQDMMFKFRNGTTDKFDLIRIKEIVLMSKSDSQMYMRAGNSITVNVVYHQLLNLLYDRKQVGQQLSLF